MQPSWSHWGSGLGSSSVVPMRLVVYGSIKRASLSLSLSLSLNSILKSMEFGPSDSVQVTATSPAPQ